MYLCMMAQVLYFPMFLDILTVGRTPPNAFGPPLTDSVSGKLLADFDYGHPPGVHSLFSRCVNTCCTGAHVQEVMASLLANCDVRQLVFSGDRMNPRRLVTPYAGLIDFDAPLVLRLAAHLPPYTVP